VRRYPTWLVGGRRYEGVLTLDELARASSFVDREATGTREVPH
jgi:hypothetical protein